MPSSKALAEVMTEGVDRINPQVIVEFGPGTGIFTEQIMRRKGPKSTFFALEINPYFHEMTQKRCPDAVVYRDSAANMVTYLTKHNAKNCDCIISSLPWASFPENLQTEIMDAVQTALKPEGSFYTFAYIHAAFFSNGKRFYRMLRNRFQHVSRSKIIWINVPPAFVYKCVK